MIVVIGSMALQVVGLYASLLATFVVFLLVESLCMGWVLVG